MLTTQAFRFTAKGEADWIKLDLATRFANWGRTMCIRVRACSLNYRDLIHARKQLGRDFAGQIPLSDGAGEVIAIGGSVARFQPGDRVADAFFKRGWVADLKCHHDAALGGSANGMLAHEVILNEEGVVRIPESLTFEEAACLPCAGLTAWYSLVTRGQFKPGDSVLCLGTGGVSVFALQFAVALGGTAIVTSSSDEKLARMKSLGASFGVNYKTTPDWDKEIGKWTGKKGVDHVVEVGGPGTLGKSMACVSAGGHIALVGVLSGFGPPESSLFPLLGRNATMSGIYVGSRAEFEAMNGFIDAKAIKPVIDRVFPFDRSIEAFHYLESGSHLGKVVIRIGD